MPKLESESGEIVHSLINNKVFTLFADVPGIGTLVAGGKSVQRTLAKKKIMSCDGSLDGNRNLINAKQSNFTT